MDKNLRGLIKNSKSLIGVSAINEIIKNQSDSQIYVHLGQGIVISLKKEINNIEKEINYIEGSGVNVLHYKIKLHNIHKRLEFFKAEYLSSELEKIISMIKNLKIEVNDEKSA